MIHLELVEKEELNEIHQIKKMAFASLYQKYKDKHSPFNESLTSLKEKYERPHNFFFKIKNVEQIVGYIRVVTDEEKSEARISPIAVHPTYDGRGYGTKGIILIEEKFQSVETWYLSTIYQEEKLVHFYSKLGYKKTGELILVQENMEMIYFVKHK